MSGPYPAVSGGTTLFYNDLEWLVSSLRERVRPMGHDGDILMSDELFERGYGNCIEMSVAFHEMCTKASMRCGFAVERSYIKRDFHILNYAFIGEEKVYVDMTAPDPLRPKINIEGLSNISPLEASIYFMAEKVTCSQDASPREKAARLNELQDILPGDFHIAYSTACLLRREDPAMAAFFLLRTIGSNPVFVPPYLDLCLMLKRAFST